MNTVSQILFFNLFLNIGYLGYTSGFSLLCMVFFLIVVSIILQTSIYIFEVKLEFLRGFTFCINESNINAFIYSQVIWKMFQIPCPMDSDIINATLINATLVPFTDENITVDDACKPKYFIFNSQVTDRIRFCI